MPSYKL